jgi:hypothetical protein
MRGSGVPAVRCAIAAACAMYAACVRCGGGYTGFECLGDVVSCCNAEQGRLRDFEWCSVPVVLRAFRVGIGKSPLPAKPNQTNRTAQAEFDPSIRCASIRLAFVLHLRDVP